MTGSDSGQTLYALLQCGERDAATHLRLALTRKRTLYLASLVHKVRELKEQNPLVRAMIVEDPEAEFVRDPEFSGQTGNGGRYETLERTGSQTGWHPGDGETVRGRRTLRVGDHGIRWSMENGGIEEARSDALMISSLVAAWCLLCPPDEFNRALARLLDTWPYKAALWARDGFASADDGSFRRPVRLSWDALKMLLSHEDPRVQDLAREALTRDQHTG